jgi:hypothetical protein
MRCSKQGCYSITSSARASSAHSSLGVNFCNPIKTDETMKPDLFIWSLIVLTCVN